MSAYTKFFPPTSIFFKYFDRHPFVAFEGEELKVPLSEDLQGLDSLTLTGNNGFMLQVSEDETEFILTNVMDGGEF